MDQFKESVKSQGEIIDHIFREQIKGSRLLDRSNSKMDASDLNNSCEYLDRSNIKERSTIKRGEDIIQKLNLSSQSD